LLVNCELIFSRSDRRGLFVLAAMQDKKHDDSSTGPWMSGNQNSGRPKYLKNNIQLQILA